MKASFTPREIVYLFEKLSSFVPVTTSEKENKESILEKLRSLIGDTLEKEENENFIEKFIAWEEKEKKKIEILEKKNQEILEEIREKSR